MNDELLNKMERDGVVVITSNIDSQSASKTILSLLNLGNTPEKEIQLFISSSTMDYTNVMAIYDVLTSLKNPISAYAIGLVGGTAVLLLLAANKGKRYILENSEVRLSELYDVVGGGSNQQTEIEILYEDVSHKEEIYESLIEKYTSLSKEEVHKYCVEQAVFNADKAKELCFVDEILR